MPPSVCGYYHFPFIIVYASAVPPVSIPSFFTLDLMRSDSLTAVAGEEKKRRPDLDATPTVGSFGKEILHLNVRYRIRARGKIAF